MSTEQTIEILKALADEVRLGMVKQIAASEKPVPSCDVVKSCETFTKLSQPALSHHFSKLTDAGVLLHEKSGTQNIYKLNKDLLTSVGIDIHKL